jgi:hypothetical protein
MNENEPYIEVGARQVNLDDVEEKESKRGGTKMERLIKVVGSMDGLSQFRGSLDRNIKTTSKPFAIARTLEKAFRQYEERKPEQMPVPPSYLNENIEAIIDALVFPDTDKGSEVKRIWRLMQSEPDQFMAP